MVYLYEIHLKIWPFESLFVILQVEVLRTNNYKHYEREHRHLHAHF
jgi:hypothetical protein